MNPLPILTLAARDPEMKDVLGVLAFIGVAMLLLAVGGAVINSIRKRALRAADDRGADSGLLDELRAARKRGDISEEEFDAAKKKISEKLRGSIMADTKVRRRP